MIVDDLERVIKDDILSVDVADMYLKIYVSDIDWKPYIANFWNNTKNKMTNEQEAKTHMKKAIACTTLAPIYDKTIIPDPPQNLLFWLPTWRQFSEKDWIDLYKKMVSEDIGIRKNRKKMLSFGIIDSVDYVPMTRQAFNWLYAKAEETNCIDNINKKDIIKKFENLVKIYGGAVICNMFAKHQNHIDKVINWRSGYFIEKEIYKAYTIEQIIKIKRLELSKIDPKFIKQLNKNKENI